MMKKVEEDSTQVSDVSTGVPCDNSVNIRNKKRMKELLENYNKESNKLNESEEVPTVPELTNGKYDIVNGNNDTAIIAADDECKNDEELIIDLTNKSDDSSNYNNPIYAQITQKLIDNGLNSRFYGSEGYYVENNSENVKIICRTLSEGFRINITGGIYGTIDSTNIQKELKKAVALVNELNDLLSEINEGEND